MPEIALDAADYDLDLTLQPSFVSSMYVRLAPRKWAKVAGALGGSLKLLQEGRVLKARCTANVSRATLRGVAELESGLWHGPFEEGLRKLPPSVRESVEALAEVYPGVRIAIAPHDFWRVFLAAVLSKRTSYYKFVLKWCRALWPLLREPQDVVAVDLSRAGTSYQLAQAKETFASCLAAVERLAEQIDKLEPEVVRVELIRSCWGVGPKVADATVLHTMEAPHFAPCDTHLKTLAEKLEWVRRGAQLPSKALCGRYACNIRYARVTRLQLCPARRCARREFVSLFGDLSGWAQTLAWLHGAGLPWTGGRRSGYL